MPLGVWTILTKSDAGGSVPEFNLAPIFFKFYGKRSTLQPNTLLTTASMTLGWALNAIHQIGSSPDPAVETLLWRDPRP